MIYFTADAHLGHFNSIGFDARPFTSVPEMEAAFINMWNHRVTHEDTVYHVGDFFWGYKTALRVAPQLKVKIICIKGNHDKSWWKPERVKREIPNLELLTDQIHIVRDEGKHPPIVLCHYPMRSWPGSARGSWHLFGHVHKQIEPWGKSMCVCWNVNDYKLVSLDQVKKCLTAEAPQAI